MKKLLLVLLLLPVFCDAQNTTLTAGTSGYVTVNGQNYKRGDLRAVYTYSTDTLISLIYTSDRTVLVKATAHAHYLFGDSASAPASSSSVLRAWLNTNFEATAASGGSGTVTSITAGSGLSGGTITTSGTIALSNPVYIDTLTLTATKMLTLKTTPYKINTHTPPAGYAIKVIGWQIKYTFGTIAYVDGFSGFNLQESTTNICRIATTNITSATSYFIDINLYQTSAAATAYTIPLIDNADLYITGGGADPTTGDGYFFHTVEYMIVPDAH